MLSYFGRRIGTARKRYTTHVEQGIGQRRRPELAKGGLIRSLGGGSEVKKMRLIGQDRLKSDERILGDRLVSSTHGLQFLRYEHRKAMTHLWSRYDKARRTVHGRGTETNRCCQSISEGRTPLQN